MNSWLHPFRHNAEQRRKTREGNLRAARWTLEKADRLREEGRHEAATEYEFAVMWATAEPKFFFPWQEGG